MPRVLQQQLDRRAFFNGYQLRAFFQKVQLQDDGRKIIVSDSKPDSGYIIPLGAHLDTAEDPRIRLLFFDFMHPTMERAAHGKKKFSLAPPDPWMLAIAYIMVEGIIPGLAWDAVKPSVNAALSTLRRHGLAPKKRRKKNDIGKSRSGFIWEEYGTDGKKTRDLFIGIEQAYEKANRKGTKDVLSKKKKKAGPKKRR